MRRPTLAVLFCLTLASCGPGWTRTDRMGPRQLPAQDQVQVFGREGTQRWHGAVITADSVSGIPWRESVECDSCRVALPMAAVDSIQIGHPTAGFWKGVGLTFGVLFGIMMAACASGGCPSST